MRLRDIKKKSTVNRINNKCNSLKTTIPKSIIEALGLKPGDQLEWTANWKKGVYVQPLMSNGNDKGGG